MSETKIPASVIMVSYNTKELTKKALTALYGSNSVPAQIIVVDNNSTDGSADMIKKQFPNVELLIENDNMGFAKANNHAIKNMATEKYIWLLNSDTEVGKNSLTEIFEYLENNQNIAAVEPLLVYPDKKLQSVGGYFPSLWNVFLYLIPLGYLLPTALKRKIKSIALYPQDMPIHGIELDYITGAAMFIRKEALDDAGLLGEDYFMYFEETDLCWRLRKKGWGIRAIKTDPVIHVYGGSYKSRYDEKRLLIFLDSLKIFVKKNYTESIAFAIIFEITILKRLSLWIKRFKN